MDGSSTLVLLPAKFKKKIWVKKGSYLIVEDSQKAGKTGKSRISGSIETILSDEDVEDLLRKGLW